MIHWAGRIKSVQKDFRLYRGKLSPITINSKGLRDGEYSFDRNDKKRILVLGDSFAWGFGVTEKERFSELLESKLGNSEIFNAAVAGYSTDQQFLYYVNEGYKFNPDIVLLLFCENDFIGNNVDKIYWYNKPKFTVDNDSFVLTNVPVPELSFYQKLRRFLSGKSYFLSFMIKRLSIFSVQSFSEEDVIQDNRFKLRAVYYKS